MMLVKDKLPSFQSHEKEQGCTIGDQSAYIGSRMDEVLVHLPVPLMLAEMVSREFFELRSGSKKKWTGSTAHRVDAVG
jgi:S-adenosylmethionine synthetase